MAKRKGLSKLMLGAEPPTKEETTKLIQKIIPSAQPKPRKESQRKSTKKYSALDAKKEPEQQSVYITKNNRVRYTTVINKTIKDNLSRIAKNKGVSVADIIEDCILEYFGKDILKD